MKKLLCVVPVLLIFAMIGAPNARADSYIPNFTCLCDEGATLTAPAVTFPSPTSIDLTLGTTLIGDFPLPAPDSATDTYQWSYGGIGFFNNAGDSITITDTTDDQTVTENLYGLNAPVPGDDVGSLTFAPVSAATPEPAPMLLMLLGLGLLLMIRKRAFACKPHVA